MEKKWFPLHSHTTYSLLDGLSKPKDIASRIEACGYAGSAMTDHGNIAAAVGFVKAMRKKNLKPVLGTELYLSPQDPSIKSGENRQLSHLVVLAKNLEGWKSLIKITSYANSRDFVYYDKPRLNLEKLSTLTGDNNLVSFSGHMGSDLANIVFETPKLAYRARTYADAKKLVHPDWLKRTTDLAMYYQDMFGKGNFFIEIQLIDQKNLPAAEVVGKALRYVSKKTGIPCVATADSHYCRKEDAPDQRILLCSALGTTLKQVQLKLDNEEDVGLGGFFKSSNYHIPSYDELEAVGHTEEELKNAVGISEMCEDYDILGQPMLPQFTCPGNIPAEEHLKNLCRDGWKKLGITKEQAGVYTDRVKHELKVINDAGLAPYFLVVQDYVNAYQAKGGLAGPGRGCLHGKTPIVLSNGNTKYIKNVLVGDLVITHDGTSKEVLKVHEYSIDEDMINIQCYFGDSKYGVTLTTDHEIYAEKAIKTGNKGRERKYLEPNGNLSWIPASNISVGDWVFIPTPKVTETNIISFDLAKYCDNGNMTHDADKVYHTKSHNQFCKNDTEHNRFLDLDDDWYKILGFFVGNGWLRSDGSPTIGFAFYNEHKNKIDLIVNKFLDFGCQVTIHKHQKRKLIQVHVNSVYFYNLFKELHPDYNFNALTKHVPEFVLNSNVQSIKKFLDGFTMADGHLGENKITYSTSSKKLADQLRYLNWRANNPISLISSDRVDDREGFKNTNKSYSLNSPYKLDKSSNFRYVKDGLLLRVRSIKNVSGVKKVYDLTVKDNHNYLTSSFLVHNSGAGCLVSYLIGITQIDPIKYGLIFERFYNAGRNAPGRVSLPDIDCDFAISKRQEVIEYIRSKYGHDCVSQMVTFSRMQGRGAIKDVLRAHEACSFEEMNRITNSIPDESEISDQLQLMREENDGEASIIRWALENNGHELKEWCHIDAKGELQGQYAPMFKQAIRLEGTKRSQGKHPAGIVISATPLAGVCPMVYDKHGNEPIAGLEMNDLEAMGHVKFDILGVAVLDKIMGVQELLRTGVMS